MIKHTDEERTEQEERHYTPDHMSNERILSKEEEAAFLESCRIAATIDYAYDELVLAHIKERGLTFKEVAERSGLNEQYFYNLGHSGSTWKSCIDVRSVRVARFA